MNDIKLFGSELRSSVLQLLALLEESFPTEIARLLGAPRISVQRIVEALELESILATRRLGHERRVTLNPRFFAYDELKALLTKLALQNRRITLAAGKRRARPRRRGKEI
jgi:DNA-binding IclR family transcriptional regulator